MGATKLCSDKLFVSGNVFVGRDHTTSFSVVRYGNVLASRGSIIPLWQEIVRNGAKELPVTDARMTRFWISLGQTVDFVENCFNVMVGGEIFVPKIPSMRIVDLAEAVAPSIPQRIIGIREGEKLHELMISVDDSRHTVELDRHYVIVPEVSVSGYPEEYVDSRGEKGQPLPDGFSFTSDNNSSWLDVNDLRSLLGVNVEAELVADKQAN